MNDILAYLESITQPDEMGPEYRELLEKQAPFEDAFLNATSWDFMNQWYDASSDVVGFERQECFSRGFRLGVRLTLAALQPSA